MIGPSYSEHYEEFNNLDENDKKRIFPGLDEKDYKQEIYPCIFLASKVDTYGYDDGWCSVKIKCEDIDKNYLEPDFVMGMNKKCFRYKKSIPAAKLEFCHERY